MMFSGEDARRLLEEAIEAKATTAKSMTQILISMYEGSDRDTVIGVAREFIGRCSCVKDALKAADLIMKFDSRNYTVPTQLPGALASRVRKEK